MSSLYSFNPQSEPSQGVGLLCDLEKYSSPKQDKVLREIAKHLADGLNYAFINLCPGEIAVRDVVDYDAVNIDLSRFPLLKVYRQTDSFSESTKGRNTDCVVAYCIAFPDQDKLPGLMQWVSIAINKLLERYVINHEHCQSNVINEARKAEYRIMVNEVATPVYAFLRINFKIIEY